MITVEACADSGTVTILTTGEPYYAEWIKGEGADIALLRSEEDNRLVGAVLPIDSIDGISVFIGAKHIK